MKISRERLKQIIKEELQSLSEKIKTPAEVEAEFEKRRKGAQKKGKGAGGSAEEDEQPSVGSAPAATGILTPNSINSGGDRQLMTAAQRAALSARKPAAPLGSGWGRDVGPAGDETSQAVSGVDVDLPDPSKEARRASIPGVGSDVAVTQSGKAVGQKPISVSSDPYVSPNPKYAGAIAAADMGGKVSTTKPSKSSKGGRKAWKSANRAMKDAAKAAGMRWQDVKKGDGAAWDAKLAARKAFKAMKSGKAARSRRAVAKTGAQAPATVAQARAESPPSVAPLTRAPSDSVSDIYSREDEKKKKLNVRKSRDMLMNLSGDELKNYHDVRKYQEQELVDNGMGPERAKKKAAQQTQAALLKTGGKVGVAMMRAMPDARKGGKRRPGAEPERMVAKKPKGKGPKGKGKGPKIRTAEEQKRHNARRKKRGLPPEKVASPDLN